MQLRKESLKKKKKKKIRLVRDSGTLDLCDTCAALWKQVVELVRYKPVKG